MAAQPPRFRREPPPPGIVYNTAMSTPDAALALAALWSYERQRRARVGGVCVTGGGYKAAVFCDIVNQFYRPGERHGNDALAVGLADAGNLPADEPMVSEPVDRVDAGGEPFYVRTIQTVTDTSLAESQLRNAITFNAESTVVLSAPATSLARSLEIGANRDLYTEPVQRLVLVDSPRLHRDETALDALLANWPTEIVVLEAGLAENLMLSSRTVEEAFGWAVDHPVIDACRAYREGAYELPALDLAAMVHAVAPDTMQFVLSRAGRIDNAGGALSFSPADGGTAYRLQIASHGGLAELLIAAAAAAPD